MKISINDGSYPEAYCGTPTFSIDCERDDVAFLYQNFDYSSGILSYKLEPFDIYSDFTTPCTLKVFYDEYPPGEDAGIQALLEKKFWV